MTNNVGSGLLGMGHHIVKVTRVWYTPVMAGAMRAIVFALCREDENMKPHWETRIEAVGACKEQSLDG